MKRQNLAISACRRVWIAILITGVLLVPESNAGRFSRVVVFGESFSDSGNQLAASDGVYPPSPPYFQGRWSNGPNWIDLVSSRLGLGYTRPNLDGGTNFAFGGTKSGMGRSVTNCSNMGLSMCFDLPGPNYGTQIETFLSSATSIGDDDLFAIWGGHNDLFSGVQPTQVAQNLVEHINTLLEHGADNVLFLNLFSGVDQAGRVNALLTQDLDTIRRLFPSATIVEVDVPTLTNEFFNNPGAWGISDFETPALNTSTLEVAAHPETHLNWDGLHVTYAFSRAIADFVMGAMDPVLLRQGDFNGDSILTSLDIDRLAEASGTNQLEFDLDLNNQIDAVDHSIWVHELMQTRYGDANLDGVFDSGDLVSVFQAGEFEDNSLLNSGWADGDWNGDREFTTADLTFAFQDGGYMTGPPPVNSVPEPANAFISASLFVIACLRRQKQRFQ